MPSSLVVHVIDDDIAVRQSLAFLFATAGISARLHESAQAFLDAAPQAAFGCVVTDIRMPGMDGLELQRELKRRGSTMPLIVITGHGDVALAVAAMKDGAVDFIEKPFDDAAIIDAVRRALLRERALIDKAADIGAAQARLAALSRRERQVLDGLVGGHSNKVIAAGLGISPRTVEIYRSHLMTKMQASSLSELVRLAVTAEANGDRAP
jgi:two-component system response regulator FixJ